MKFPGPTRPGQRSFGLSLMPGRRRFLALTAANIAVASFWSRRATSTSARAIAIRAVRIDSQKAAALQSSRSNR